MIKLFKWTGLLFNLIPLADDKSYDSVSFEEMKEVVSSEKVFEFLEDKFGKRVDFSLYTKEERTEICKELWQICGGQSGRERKKFGVENNGICLLMAYVADAIQKDS